MSGPEAVCLASLLPRTSPCRLSPAGRAGILTSTLNKFGALNIIHSLLYISAAAQQRRDVALCRHLFSCLRDSRAGRVTVTSASGVTPSTSVTFRTPEHLTLTLRKESLYVLFIVFPALSICWTFFFLLYVHVVS